MTELNPVTAEILRNKFDAIVAEMRATLTSTAYSPMIGEAQECCSAIFTENTSLVAIDNPVHLFSMADTATSILDRFQYDLGPEDMIVTNDPYSGGSRVQEFTLIAPVSDHDEIVFYLGVRGHIEDFGGDLRGNLNPKAREIWQEGARCTPVRLYRDGRLVQDALNTLLLNSRAPEAMQLDLEAMAAAITVGRRRFEELLGSHGRNIIVAAMEWTIDYAARRLSTLLSQWPTGSHQGVSILPHDCQNRENLHIRAALKVQNGLLKIDLSDSDDQSTGFTNITRSMACGYALLPVLAAVGTAVPRNSGIARCVEIATRPGSLVEPAYPAPTGWSVDHAGHEVANAVSTALAQLLPKATANVVANKLLAFTVKRGIRHGNTLEQLDTYDYSRFAQGGCSGTYECDGWGMATASAAAPLPSVELYETRAEGWISSLEFDVDSSGPGQWRGGPGTTARLMPVQATDGEHYLTACVIAMDPAKNGVADGQPGTANSLAVAMDGANKVIEKTLLDTPLTAGAEITLTMGGGAGWGHPFCRDPRLVLQDVLNDYVSRDAARQHYGVAIRADDTIDDAETTKLRQTHHRAGEAR